jgi:hypothetical protein
VSPATTPSTGDPGASRTHGALALAAPPSAVARPSEAPRSVVVTLNKPAPIAPAVPAAPAPAAHREVPVPAPAPAQPAARTDRAPELEAWRSIVEGVRRVRAPLASILEHAVPLRVGPDAVVIGFEANAAFLCARASDPEALDAWTRVVRAHFGTPTRVEVQPSSGISGAPTLAAIAAERRSADLAQRRTAVESHPLVRAAVQIFDAQLRDVRLPKSDG